MGGYLGSPIARAATRFVKDLAHLESGSARSRILLVAACFCGLTASAAAINIFGFAVLLKPLSDKLALSRGALSLGVALGSATTAIASLLVGWLMDRYGVRRVMVPGIILFAAATLCFGLVPQAHAGVIFLVFVVGGVATAVQQPIGYVKMITTWIDRGRGLSLGVALSGVGVGGLLVPQIAAHVEHAFGIAAAFLALSATVLLLALLPVTLCFHDPAPPPLSRRDEAGHHGDAAEGYDLARAIKDPIFWRLNLALLFSVCAINGTLTHLVSMLTDRGFSQQSATNTLSAAGIFIAIGRVSAGWLLDRVAGRLVAAIFVLAPIAGIGLLGSDLSGTFPIMAAILCGLGVGAEVDLTAYFLGRYFGARAMGAMFGVAAAVLALGTAAGPFIMGRAFDVYGHYLPALLAFEALLVIALLLFATLGSYRFIPAARPSHAE